MSWRPVRTPARATGRGEETLAAWRISRSWSPSAFHTLAEQIVGDGAVVPGELPHEPRGVVGVLQGQGGQAQCGGPALGARHQRGDLGARECHRLVVEQPLGLGGVERQLVGAHLPEPVRELEPVEPDRGVEAAAEHDRHSR